MSSRRLEAPHGVRVELDAEPGPGGQLNVSGHRTQRLREQAEEHGVVVAHAEHVASLGLDGERDKLLGPELIQMICTPAEQQRTAAADAIVYFAAKEAFYKCQYPLTRQFLDFVHPSFDKGYPAQLGFPAIIPQDAFPAIIIDGVLPFGSGRGGFAGGYRRQHTIQVADSLTWTKGVHVFKVGTDQRWNRFNFVNRLNPSGSFNFGASLTNNPLSPAGTVCLYSSVDVDVLADVNGWFETS